MRTQMLGGMALVLGAVAFLGSGAGARAEVWAGNAATYPQGYSGSPSAAAYGYSGYGQGVRPAGYGQYYQGYGYPNYAYYYPNYYYNYPRTATPYQYPQQATSAPPRRRRCRPRPRPR